MRSKSGHNWLHHVARQVSQCFGGTKYGSCPMKLLKSRAVSRCNSGSGIEPPCKSGSIHTSCAMN